MVGAAIILVLLRLAGFRSGAPGDIDLLQDSAAHEVKNLSVSVEGATFGLIDGKAEIEIAPGSATKNKLSIFGEPVFGDLDDDGDDDAAMLLANDPGGSGTFYYAVLAIKYDTAYQSTNALLLGDRIAPQTKEIRDGRALFNFAERRADEPVTTRPSIGRSVWIRYDKSTGLIDELVGGIEGGADPTRK